MFGTGGGYWAVPTLVSARPCYGIAVPGGNGGTGEGGTYTPPGPSGLLSNSPSLCCDRARYATLARAMAPRKDAQKRRTSKPVPGSRARGAGRRAEVLPLSPKERDEVVTRIVSGETMVGAMRSMNFKPTRLIKTFDIDNKFERAIREARRLKAYMDADRAERITGHFFKDDGSVDDKTKLGSVDKDEVALRRNAAEHLRWAAERGNPDAFSPKVDVGTSDRNRKSWADLATTGEDD